jgi:hypothetical protein
MKKKDLFWLTVLEVSVQDWVAPLFLASGRSVRWQWCGGHSTAKCSPQGPGSKGEEEKTRVPHLFPGHTPWPKDLRPSHKALLPKVPNATLETKLSPWTFASHLSKLWLSLDPCPLLSMRAVIQIPYKAKAVWYLSCCCSFSTASFKLPVPTWFSVPVSFSRCSQGTQDLQGKVLMNEPQALALGLQLLKLSGQKHCSIHLCQLSQE